MSFDTKKPETSVCSLASVYTARKPAISVKVWSIIDIQEVLKINVARLYQSWTICISI